MKELIDKKDIEGYLKKLLLILPKGIGDINMIRDLISIVEDEILKQSLIELEELYENQENKDICFDLSMAPAMKYYTGVLIKGYSPYSAQPIISGGRYDHLMNHFNKEVPAIGLSYDFHHIMHALEMEDEIND
jgi:ATP phosphoribosyltransferase regulatory subunit